ncbi:MAG: hypothetical protein ACYTGS_15875 [Planctomycetota bacterium]|jgi:hypothetical protein
MDIKTRFDLMNTIQLYYKSHIELINQFAIADLSNDKKLFDLLNTLDTELIKVIYNRIGKLLNGIDYNKKEFTLSDIDLITNKE